MDWKGGNEMTKEEMILKLIGDGYLIEQVWAKDFRELVLQIKVWDPRESSKVWFAKFPIDGRAGKTILECVKRVEYVLLHNLFDKIYEMQHESPLSYTYD